MRLGWRYAAGSVAAVTAGVVAAAVLVGTGSGASTPEKIDAGTHSCTTDASGFCAAQTHDLGSVPVSVVATAKAPITGTTVQTLDTDSFTAATFRVRAFKANGSALTNSAITYSYAAFSGPAPSPTPTVSTSPSPSPTVTTSSPPGGWPDATNTGVPAGTTLTAYTGPSTISTAGTVIDSKTVTTCLTVTAAGVVIKNSSLHVGGCAVVDLASSGSLTIQDSTLTCNGGPGTAIETDLATGSAFTLTVSRVDVSGCENGFDADSNTLIEDSYIHDLYQSAQAHTDGIQSARAMYLTVRHNRIYANDGTSAIISPQASVNPHDTLIENNLMAGGAFTLYCPQNGPGVNWRVTGNQFSTVFYPTVGAFGPWTDCQDETLSGNVYYDGPNAGQLVPPQ